MEQVIEAVKDEVAKNYGYKDFSDVLQNCETRMIKVEQAMELYHSRKCEEAGKELPKKYDVLGFCEKHIVLGNRESDTGSISSSMEIGAEWMKEHASTLIAAKQGEIDRLKKVYEDNIVELLDKKQEEIRQFKSQLEAKDKEIEQRNNYYENKIETLQRHYSNEYMENEDLIKDMGKLKSQLEAKDKEIANLNSIIDSDPTDVKFRFKGMQNDIENLESQLQEVRAEVKKVTNERDLLKLHADLGHPKMRF